MRMLSFRSSENRQTLALAAPIIAGFVGQMLMGLADTIMVGRVGVVPLAACAFANTLLSVPLVFGFGVLSAVSVRASRAHGGRTPAAAGHALRAGLVIALVLGIAATALFVLSIPHLAVMGQKQEVNAACANYLILCAASSIPLFLTTAAKNFCEALAKPWVPFWIMLAGVLLNVVLNAMLIYGLWGAPAMGLDGAGLATLIARIAVMAGLFAFCWFSHSLRPAMPQRWLDPNLGPELTTQLKIGLPAGGMHLFEVGGFAIGSLMTGWISVNGLAAHQIAITCAGTTFMVPLGLAQAVSVRVGHAIGAKTPERCRPIVFEALAATVGLMAVFAFALLLGGEIIAGIFVADTAVIALAIPLLKMAGVFQIFDGIQVVCGGALRGFADTKVPMFIGILSYWVVALPVSYGAAFVLGFGVTGVWFGFVVGLAVAAVALFARLLPRVTLSPTPSVCR
jgi:MATE family multidrug resistance protein